MIDRYQCFTGHDATNYDATLTDDGPWVTYEDHAKEIATLRAGLEVHDRLAHDDAKAAWEKECSERDIAEEKLEAAERERDDD